MGVFEGQESFAAFSFRIQAMVRAEKTKIEFSIITATHEAKVFRKQLVVKRRMLLSKVKCSICFDANVWKSSKQNVGYILHHR